jgi:hypothetical protein
MFCLIICVLKNHVCDFRNHVCDLNNHVCDSKIMCMLLLIIYKCFKYLHYLNQSFNFISVYKTNWQR